MEGRSCPQSGRLNTLTVWILHKLTERIGALPKRTPKVFCEKAHVMQRAKNIQDTLEEKGRIGLLDIKTYDGATVIKKVWYWCRDRHVGQWTTGVQK